MPNEKRKFIYSFSSLNTQLFFFVILPISLLLLAITFGSLSLHRGAMRDLVAVRDQRTVNGAASAIREQLTHRAATIQGIAIRSTGGDTVEEILSSVEFLFNDFGVGIAFFSAEGQLLGYHGNDRLWEDLVNEITVQVSILAPKLEGQPLFSEPFLDPAQSDYYALVLMQSDSTGPVTVGIFSVTNLARQSLSGILSYDNQGSVVLVDQNNNLLFRTGFLEVTADPSNHPGVAEALIGESGTTYLLADDGEHVIAFSPVAPTNWALVIEEPWKSIASPLLRYSESGSLILVPIVIFALFALWFATIRIIQPLNEFQNQVMLFTQGNYEAFKKPVGGIDEIRTLQTAFIDMAEEVENTQETLKKFLNIITSSQEDERKRLARELHDDTLQSLIALNHRVMMVKRQAVQAGLQDAFSEIEAMLAQTMQELRRLTRALRPIYLEDLGLDAALESLSLETSEVVDIPISFTSQGHGRRLPDNIEIALYRISQEALNNIARHSGASKAEVSLSYNTGDIVMTISDNGKGFDPPKNPRDLSNIGHYGLLGIYERAELIGAKFSIESDTDVGTTIIVQIPY